MLPLPPLKLQKAYYDHFNAPLATSPAIPTLSPRLKRFSHKYPNKSSESPKMSSGKAASPMPSKPLTNGVPKPFASSPAVLATSLCPPPARHSSFRHNSLTPSQRSSFADEYSLSEIFRLITQMRICVIRRSGSDVDGQISSMINAATRAVSNGDKATDEEECSPPVVHFLSIGHQNAGQMLDWVQRKGLPLIFLNGDCVGGLNEFKALEKRGFLAESLHPHQFDLVVIGGGGTNDVANSAVEEAVRLGKRVALVELAQSDNGTQRRSSNSKLAKQAVNQAALMRTAIEEARSSGWTVEGEQGQRVSFWLDWCTVREGIECGENEEQERLKAIFGQGKVHCIKASACQFSGFHELTICPTNVDDSKQKSGLLKLNAARFLLVTKSEAKTLENVSGALENSCCISNEEIFCLDYNPGKTLFCCEHDDQPDVLESAAILAALGNDVTIMACATKPDQSKPVHSFDAELVQHAKEQLVRKGVRFMKCMPTKFEQLREPTADRAGICQVHALKVDQSEETGTDNSMAPFLEEFNTVVLSLGKRSEPFRGLGLDKINIQLSAKTGRLLSRAHQSISVPNIYAIGDALEEDVPRSDDCFAARQLLRQMFEGELNSIGQSDLCRTLLLPPLEYSCCGLSEQEAEKKYGKQSLSIARDKEVPLAGVEKAKMICLKMEQERVIGLHVIGANASKLLQGYSLAMQLGLTRTKLEQMNGNGK